VNFSAEQDATLHSAGRVRPGAAGQQFEKPRHRCVPMLRYKIFLSVFLFCNIAIAAPVPADTKDHYQPNQILPNACKPSELRRLKKESERIARKYSKNPVFPLVKAMLCGDDVQSYRYVLTHTTGKILIDDNLTREDGQGEERPAIGSSIVLIRMLAWAAEVREIENTISIGYSDGGVCSGSFGIQYIEDSWKISNITFYCD
jgi:hypothetical protein